MKRLLVIPSLLLTGLLGCIDNSERNMVRNTYKTKKDCIDDNPFNKDDCEEVVGQGVRGPWYHYSHYGSSYGARASGLVNHLGDYAPADTMRSRSPSAIASFSSQGTGSTGRVAVSGFSRGGFGSTASSHSSFGS